MSDLVEGCGCVWNAFSAMMVIGGIIFALRNDSPKKSSYALHEYSAPKVETPVYTPSPTYSAPVVEQPRVTSHSFSPAAAFDESYNEGYEQGENDGRHGHSHGFGYDDSNDYYNHYESMYCEAMSPIKIMAILLDFRNIKMSKKRNDSKILYNVITLMGSDLEGEWERIQSKSQS